MLLRYFTRNLALAQLNSSECNRDSTTVRDYQQKFNVTLRTVVYLNNSYCLASSVYATSSVSPAFDRFDDGLLVQTNLYPAWTESSWNGVQIQMKLFMYTSASVSYLALSLGLVATLAAIFFTVLFNKYSSTWFLLKNTEQTTEFFE
jgi:hypothetical protein